MMVKKRIWNVPGMARFLIIFLKPGALVGKLRFLNVAIGLNRNTAKIYCQLECNAAVGLALYTLTHPGNF